jgi:hypothetical protein
MYVRTGRGAALAAVLVICILGANTAGAATPEEDLIAAASSGASAKLGPWLANLDEEYQQSSDKRAFRTRNPMLRIQNGKTAMDLYASDAADLRRDLAQLGATNVRTKGPLVTAQVPVSALSRLAALPSLQFAMPAIARFAWPRRAIS